MGYGGKLQKMEIRAFKDENFSPPADTFTVLINPEKYAQSYTICYNDVRAQGSSGPSPEFNKISADGVSFELVFDGTGVVSGRLPGLVPYTDDGIKSQLEEFKKIVCGYDGSIHSPRFLELSWGTLLFRCRLTKLDLTYTLFKPDGTPLRARANVSFTSYQSADEQAKENQNESADLSHLVTVKAGDTLPLLCYRVYGSSVYYRQVAEINGLTSFRALEPGAKLLFPPLRGAAR